MKMNNTKTCGLICISAILLSACDAAYAKDAAATATKAIETASAANGLGIKIPESPDPELNAFFKSYAAHLNEYLPAVRRNDKAQMDVSFQKERKFRIQLLYMPARLDKTMPAEGVKYQNFRQRTANYWNEIEKSDYVQQLHDKEWK